MTLVAIERLIHDGRFVVFRARPDQADPVRMIGERDVFGRAPEPGEVWRVGGRWESDATHGRQVRVSKALIERPSGSLIVDAIAQGRMFPGIGAVRARKLWNHFGNGLFAHLDAGEADALEPVVGASLAVVLTEGWRELGEDASTCRWLAEHHFSPALARKVIDVLGVSHSPSTSPSSAGRSTIRQIEEDPYRMLAFVDWRTTDAAAQRLGVSWDDPRRLVGAAETVLLRRLQGGHTWSSESGAAADVSRLLRTDHDIGRRAIEAALERRAVTAWGDGVQLSGCHIMERVVADSVRSRLDTTCGHTAGDHPPGPSRLESLLERFRTRSGHTLNVLQRAAVRMAISSRFSLLLGGPGVGKTTALAAIHEVAEDLGRPVLQAALSARAAQRLGAETGRPAHTIARLLALAKRGEVRVTPDALLIIDESSMLDLPTLYNLLAISEHGSSVLLTGDPGQLPPIGFGLTFHVFAADRGIARTELLEVVRQSDATGIPRVCQAIRNGVLPALDPRYERFGTGVSFIETVADDLTASVVTLVQQYGHADYPQVISPLKRGAGGVHDVNGAIHVSRARADSGESEDFLPGEPVIGTRNSTDAGMLNGEMGIVVGRDEHGRLLCDFAGDLRTIPQGYTSNLELAYAVTCHKAQGSEFPRVVIPVRRSRLLDRTLLLTAISRAKEQVVVIGDRAAFEEAVQAPGSSSLREVGLGRSPN